MLAKLNELRGSLNDEQKNTLHDAFPEDIVQRLLSAADEGTATKVVEDMNKYLAARPMVAFELYKKLLPEQRAMITDLVFDDED